MATSEVAICNRALQKVGEPQITSLDDPSRAARECKRLYSFARDMLQRIYVFNFTITRVSLPEIGGFSDFDFSNAYNLPNDYMRLVKINTSAEYRIEGNRILINQAAPLDIVYCRRVTNTTQFDPLFTEALAAYMASELAEIILQSANKKEQLYSLFIAMVNRAVGVDAKEQHPMQFEESDWVKSRW